MSDPGIGEPQASQEIPETPGEADQPPASASWRRRIVIGLALVVSLPLYLLAVAWAFGALHFDLPLPAGARNAAALTWGVAASGFPVFLRPRWKGLLAVALCFAAILGWWLTLSPRQDRDWRPDVARLASATVEGSVVTIRELRDFEWHSATDFTPRYQTRTYDLDQIRGCDLFLNFWGSDFMAHPVLSFDFGEGGRVCFSIETRPEEGEAYSALGGFYRMFELIYIVADELDVVRVRTNFREPQDVYLYPLNLTPEETRERFREYLERVNALHARPEWYNAVTSNCTTSIRMQHARSERIPMDWRMIANGRLDELLYEQGFIRQTRPFPELKQRAHVNERARAVTDLSRFSEEIRKGL